VTLGYTAAGISNCGDTKVLHNIIEGSCANLILMEEKVYAKVIIGNYLIIARGMTNLNIEHRTPHTALLYEKETIWSPHASRCSPDQDGWQSLMKGKFSNLSI
jgi:hypothetical protein